MTCKTTLIAAALLLGGCTVTQHADNQAGNEIQIAQTIIAMEKAALDRWGKGDPSGFLEISAPDVVYFDPAMPKRLDGLAALTDLYENIRGQVRIDHYELIDPKVQVCDNAAAVLTYNFVCVIGDQTMRENCTEVYRRQNDRWQIIQTHWSVTKPSN
ncbi:MAG: DUF4440 domain-containing protein [Planctomycetaceae bacterium]|nr:DUF4440 domain-containing protein [Planctomycetaceae bacterium]